MKNILSVGIVLLALMNISFVSAQVGGTITKTAPAPTYDSAEAFLEAEGNTCEAATDGCNTITINNGAFGATTLKHCEQHTAVYSCVKQKEFAEVCTLEYAPVCGTNGVTYSNTCMADAAFIEIAQEGACDAEMTESADTDNLSANDRSLYNHVRDQVDSGYVSLVDRAIAQYEKNLKRKRWSREKMIEVNDGNVERVEAIISNLLMKYPQDTALPAKAHDRYLKLTLIKFALMDLDL